MPGPRQRGAWNNHWEYILATLGVVVGIGNVLRFPYVTYANGGGSFLLPYVLMLTVIAFPLLFLDMAIGQYSQAGINKVRVHNC